MRTTIDRAGRLVIPKALRDSVGLEVGEVEVDVADGVVTVAPVRDRARLEERDGRLVVVGSGPSLSVEELREMRLGLQR